MTTKLITRMLTVILLLLAAVIFLQQRTLTRLQAEAAALRVQISQVEAARDEEKQAVAQNKDAVESSRAERTELMRLRAELARLRQAERENAQAKVARPRPATGIIQEQPVPAPAPAEQPQPVAAPGVDGAGAPIVTLNLGVVELSEGAPSHLNLGNGKECVVVTTVLPDGNLQLVFTTDSQAPDGTPTQVTQTVTAPPGSQLASLVNGVQLVLQPTLKAK